MDQKSKYDPFSDEEVRGAIKWMDLWSQKNLTKEESRLLHTCFPEFANTPVYKQSIPFGPVEFKQIITNAMSNILNSEKKGLKREIPLWGKG